MNFHIVLKYVWGSRVDSSSRAVDIFYLSVAEMSGLGASLAVWSYYLPVYTPFYFSISSMNTGAGLTITSLGFIDAYKLWKHVLNFSYFKYEKISEIDSKIYIPVQNCFFFEQLSLSFFFGVKFLRLSAIVKK